MERPSLTEPERIPELEKGPSSVLFWGHLFGPCAVVLGFGPGESQWSRLAVRKAQTVYTALEEVSRGGAVQTWLCPLYWVGA